MPAKVKQAIAVLVLGLIFMLIGGYIDSISANGVSMTDPIMLTANLIWAGAVAWIISEIRKKQNVLMALYAVSAVMVALLVWHVVDYGFVLSQVFYVLEFAFFLLSAYFLKTPSSKAWHTDKTGVSMTASR